MKSKSSLIMLPIAFALLVSGVPRDILSAVSPPSAKIQPPVPSNQASPAPAAKASAGSSSATAKEQEAQNAYYHYNPVGKPDPFLPFVEKELELKKKAEQAKKTIVPSIFPLQRYSLDQFNLVGIAGDAKRRLAIVETKNNKGKFYPLAVGTIIGLNKGTVVEIRGDRIVVSEVASGGRKVNNIIIRLHKGENEGIP